jgi:transcriptional regulator with XRE-family HTH domain
MRRPPRANARTVAEARRQGEIAKAESASVQQADLHEEINKRVGRRIRQLREASRWSQEILAARLGMNRSYTWRYESGESPVMPQQLYELSRMGGVSVDWFFTPPPPPDSPAGRVRPTIAPAFAQEVALLLKYARAMSPEKRKAFLATLYEFDGDRAVEVSRE